MVRLVFKCSEYDVPVVVPMRKERFLMITSSILPSMTCSCCGRIHGWQLNKRLHPPARPRNTYAPNAKRR